MQKRKTLAPQSDVKHNSDALRRVCDLSFQPAGMIESHDIIFMYEDEYYIVETLDGRFWAASNEAMEDSYDAEAESDAARKTAAYGDYFFTVEAAVNAVREWKTKKSAPPLCHNPPILPN